MSNLPPREASRRDDARVVDGLGQVIHERLFAVEQSESGEFFLREAAILGDLHSKTR